jgi:hypothetical protein
MNKGIDHTVSHLTRRQGVGVNRIQDREHRLNVFVHKGLFVTGGFTGDNRAFVGFRAGGWQGQHGAHRDCAFDVAAAGFQDMPRIDAVSIVPLRR